MYLVMIAFFSGKETKFMVEIFLLILQEKALFTKEDLLTANQESWKHFDKEYCLSEIHIWKNWGSYKTLLRSY